MKEPSPPKKILKVKFYTSGNGKEPVKEWIKSLDKEARRIVGEDIKTVEFGWPIGMPLVKHLEGKLWEVRSSIPSGIARVIFVMCDGFMVLLHGFIKKTQKTPQSDLSLARQRAKNMEV